MIKLRQGRHLRPRPAWAALRDDDAMSAILAYVAAAIIGLWGVAHAVPTRQVVAGFRDTSLDNRRVLLQEWLAEAVTHIRHLVQDLPGAARRLRRAAPAGLRRLKSVSRRTLL